MPAAALRDTWNKDCWLFYVVGWLFLVILCCCVNGKMFTLRIHIGVRHPRSAPWGARQRTTSAQPSVPTTRGAPNRRNRPKVMSADLIRSKSKSKSKSKPNLTLTLTPLTLTPSYSRIRLVGFPSSRTAFRDTEDCEIGTMCLPPLQS